MEEAECGEGVLEWVQRFGFGVSEQGVEVAEVQSFGVLERGAEVQRFGGAEVWRRCRGSRRVWRGCFGAGAEVWFQNFRAGCGGLEVWR